MHPSQNRADEKSGHYEKCPLGLSKNLRIFRNDDFVFGVDRAAFGRAVIDDIFKQEAHGKPSLLLQITADGAGDFALTEQFYNFGIVLKTHDGRLNRQRCISHRTAYIGHTAAGDEQRVQVGMAPKHGLCLRIRDIG